MSNNNIIVKCYCICKQIYLMCKNRPKESEENISARQEPPRGGGGYEVE